MKRTRARRGLSVDNRGMTGRQRYFWKRCLRLSHKSYLQPVIDADGSVAYWWHRPFTENERRVWLTDAFVAVMNRIECFPEGLRAA